MSSGRVPGTDDAILDAIFGRPGEIVHPNIPDPEKLIHIDSNVLMRLQQLEQDAVHLAESKDINGAIDKFSEAIQLEPRYASAYNNRAQAYRLKGDDEAALNDLDKAIELGYGQSSTLKMAHTQRAILYKKLNRLAQAEQEFQKGAQYGNEVALSLVKSNPYAKLCNAMVSEAMSRLTDQR